jgi:pimeloyl-ACP methyl ester carboxylesterase
MKKHFLLFFLVFVVFRSTNLTAQNLVAKTDSGSINGADYRILFPANWKGKLVMYAHGYEVKGIVQQFSKGPFFQGSVTPFLEKGFAVAASDYSTQGFAYVQGVNETEALRKYFIKKYGKPDSTFMVGGSMGGAIALATMENFGNNYNGGLPLCPLASPLYSFFSGYFNLYAGFNALFPGIEPSLSEIFAPNTSDTFKPMNVPQMYSKLDAIKKGVLAKDSTLAITYGKQLEIKLSDLPFTIVFIEAVMRDLAQRAKGNPFDNTNTIYTGFPDNWEINKKVELIAATVDPNTFFSTYDRTGNINKPVVLMHTLYDQLLNPSVIEKFENIVKKQGKLQNLIIKYTNGQGHCNFTPQQTGEAFDELRAWANTGKKPSPGGIE